MTLSDFAIGSRVRVKSSAEWVDPKAKDIVGALGTVKDYFEDFLLVAIDDASGPNEWLLLPDEVEPAS